MMPSASSDTQRPGEQSVRRDGNSNHLFFGIQACLFRGFSDDGIVDGESVVRRKFGAWSAMLGIALQTFFALFNTIRSGFVLDCALDLASVFMLVAVLVVLCGFRNEKVAYRLGAAIVIFVCTYTAWLTTLSPENALLISFVLPAVFFFLLGLREALLWLAPVGAALAGYCIFPETVHRDPFPMVVIVRFLSSFFIFTGYSAMVQYFRERSMRELQQAETLFQRAARELKTISGLVPICSYCKKILDEQGYWRHLELFLKNHTGVHVSSGYCESCAQRLGKGYESGGFPVPASLEPLLLWKETFENMRRKFVVYSGLIGSALLWGFIQRDIVQGRTGQAVTQIIISGLLLATVWIQHRASNPRTGFWLVSGLLFALLTQPFFFEGAQISELYWLYLLPLFSSFLLGVRVSVILSTVLLGFACMVLFVPHFPVHGNVTANTRLYFILSFTLVSTLSIYMERLRQLYMQVLMQRLASVEQTYRSIRTVKGLVPVCRECKSIRNDHGFWTRFDRYLLENADVVFSHGICESCLAREAPDVLREMQEETEGAKKGSTI